MKSRKKGPGLALIVSLVTAAAVLAGTSSAAPSAAPFSVKRSWGTFTLNPKIADKVKKGEKINYVFSYQASGIALFSQQYAQGHKAGCADGQKIYPMDCSSIAPVQTDPNQQVAQIEAKLAAGKVDCLSIEPATSDAMTAITNKVMDQGIPVFT